MTKKMGFAAVLAIVFGSQIGAGILVLPSQLAPYGAFGLFGWGIAGLIAMMLAFVFAKLCSEFPVTGGPYAYVRQAFGNIPAFFTGWAYWLASMVSNIVLVITAIQCLSPFLGENPFLYSVLEIILIFALMLINCKSVILSGNLETILTLLKFIPFCIVPLIVCTNFDASNIQISAQYSDVSPVKVLISVATMSFFCFIGVECATTPAENVENPSKTIPRAIIVGTFCVALVYFINNLAIMGVIPGNELSNSAAPFVEAIEKVCGRDISRIVSVITSIVIVGTLNAWLLTSSQILLGLAENGLMPKILAKKNTSGSPYISVIVNCVAMIPILWLTKIGSLTAQIMSIIDFSVITFLYVYLICTLVFLKITKNNWAMRILGIITISACSLIIIESSVVSISYSAIMVVCGVIMIPFIDTKFFFKKT